MAAKSGGMTATALVEYLTEEERIEKELAEILEPSPPEGAEREVEYLLEGNPNEKTTNERFREDLVFVSVANMPKWAIEEGIKENISSQLAFFRASEYYEKFNQHKGQEPCVTYREWKFAIPNDLTLEQKKELLNDFLKTAGIDHLTYCAVLHSKPAQLMSSIDPDARNDHFHIMWSDRIPDIRKTDKEHYFSNGEKEGRWSKNNLKTPCQKDKTYQQEGLGKRTIIINEVRKIIENVINENYKKNGIDKTVYSGTSASLIEKARATGDTRTEELASVAKQKRLSVRETKDKNNPIREEVMSIKKEINDIKQRHNLEDFQKSPEFHDFQTKEYAADNREDFEKILAFHNISNEAIENVINNEPSKPLLDYTNIDNEIPKNKSDIEKYISDIEARIADLKFEYATSEDLRKIEKDVTTKEDLEEAIKYKTRMMSKNPYKTAIHKTFRETPLLPEVEKHTKELDSLKWNKAQIAEREAIIIARHYATDTNAQAVLLQLILKNNTANVEKIDPMKMQCCTKQERSALRWLHREREKLEKSTKEFHEKHIEPKMDIIKDFEARSIKLNTDLGKAVDKLRSQINDIDNKTRPQTNPILDPIKPIEEKFKLQKIDFDNVAIEIKKINEQIKNNNNPKSPYITIERMAKYNGRTIAEIDSFLEKYKTIEKEHSALYTKFEEVTKNYNDLLANPITARKEKNSFFSKDTEKIEHMAKLELAKEIYDDVKWDYDQVKRNYDKIIVTHDKVISQTKAGIKDEFNATKTEFENKLSAIRSEMIQTGEELRTVEQTIREQNPEQRKTSSLINPYRYDVDIYTKKSQGSYMKEVQLQRDKFANATGSPNTTPRFDMQIAILLTNQGYSKADIDRALEKHSNTSDTHGISDKTKYRRSIATLGSGKGTSAEKKQSVEMLKGVLASTPPGYKKNNLSLGGKSSPSGGGGGTGGIVLDDDKPTYEKLINQGMSPEKAQEIMDDVDGFQFQLTGCGTDSVWDDLRLSKGKNIGD